MSIHHGTARRGRAVSCRPAAAAVLIACAVASAPASAGRYGYTQFLTDGVTVNPDGGTFYAWHARIDGDTVVFTNFTSSQSDSIWSWRYGVFHKLVSTSTPIPGGGGNFAGFDTGAFVQPTVLRNGVVLFRAVDASGNAGFYTVPIEGGAVTRIVDSGTGIPGGGASFDVLREDQFGTDGTTVVFSGNNTAGNVGGVFATAADGTGAITPIAWSGVPVNSDACAFPVNDFGRPAIDAGHIVSYGQTVLDPSGGWDALYADIVDGVPTPCNEPTFPGPYENLANADQRLPGDPTPTTHLVLTGPLVAGDTVVFVARNGNSFGGLYTVPFGDTAQGGGTLTKIIDSNTALPGTTPFDVQQDSLTFTVNGAHIFFCVGSRGVFRWNNGAINKVLAVGDTLDGHPVTAVTLGDVNGFYATEAHPNTSSGDERVVLWVELDANANAFYVASEPIFSSGFER
jgi:hypothetical protein